MKFTESQGTWLKSHFSAFIWLHLTSLDFPLLERVTPTDPAATVVIIVVPHAVPAIVVGSEILKNSKIERGDPPHWVSPHPFHQSSPSSLLSHH